MKDVIGRLVLAYRRELELYGEVLELAQEGVRLVRDCRPLGELHAVNERKRVRLTEIEEIERHIHADKRAWRDHPATSTQGMELQTLLRRLTDRIEQILLAERETDGERFERVWKAMVETLELDRLNDLIKEHNTFYPIEANLKEHPDTGKLMIGNTPWKPKKKLTSEYLLDKYPPDLKKAKEAAGAEEE